MGAWRYNSTREVSGLLHVPGHFTPGERTLLPGAHCRVGWVGPGANLAAVMRRKFTALPGIEPRSLSPYTNHYTDKYGGYSDIS